MCPGSLQHPWKPPTSAHPEASRGSGPSDSICSVTGPAGPQSAGTCPSSFCLGGNWSPCSPPPASIQEEPPVPTGWEVWPPQLAAPSSQQGVNTVQGRCCCLFKREEGRHCVNPRAPRAARPTLSGTLSMKPHSGPRLVPTSRGKGWHAGRGALDPWRALLLVEGHTPYAFKGILVALPHLPPTPHK